MAARCPHYDLPIEYRVLERCIAVVATVVIVFFLWCAVVQAPVRVLIGAVVALLLTMFVFGATRCRVPYPVSLHVLGFWMSGWCLVFGVSAIQTMWTSTPLLPGLVDLVALCVFGYFGARYLSRRIGLSLQRAMLLYVGTYLWLLFGVLGVNEELTWGVGLALLPQFAALLVGISLGVRCARKKWGHSGQP